VLLGYVLLGKLGQLQHLRVDLLDIIIIIVIIFIFPSMLQSILDPDGPRVQMRELTDPELMRAWHPPGAGVPRRGPTWTTGDYTSSKQVSKDVILSIAYMAGSNISDSWHFGEDPDLNPWIHASY
jgi:hypothetical protein